MMHGPIPIKLCTNHYGPAATTSHRSVKETVFAQLCNTIITLRHFPTDKLTSRAPVAQSAAHDDITGASETKLYIL